MIVCIEFGFFKTCSFEGFQLFKFLVSVRLTYIFPETQDFQILSYCIYVVVYRPETCLLQIFEISVF